MHVYGMGSMGYNRDETMGELGYQIENTYLLCLMVRVLENTELYIYHRKQVRVFENTERRGTPRDAMGRYV